MYLKKQKKLVWSYSGHDTYGDPEIEQSGSPPISQICHILLNSGMARR